MFRLTPAEYEQAVKRILDAGAGGLVAYSSSHLETIAGRDGDYTFDVTARFEAFDVQFLVLVECKRYRRPVEREKVQVLLMKMQSVGAHKGMLFSTSGFQQGAVEVAQAHGIALVRLADDDPDYINRSGGPMAPPDGHSADGPHCGWWLHGSTRTRLAPDQPLAVRQALGLSG